MEIEKMKKNEREREGYISEVKGDERRVLFSFSLSFSALRQCLVGSCNSQSGT